MQQRSSGAQPFLSPRGCGSIPGAALKGFPEALKSPEALNARSAKAFPRGNNNSSLMLAGGAKRERRSSKRGRTTCLPRVARARPAVSQRFARSMRCRRQCLKACVHRIDSVPQAKMAAVSAEVGLGTETSASRSAAAVLNVAGRAATPRRPHDAAPPRRLPRTPPSHPWRLPGTGNV